jgi:hypothetical protein
MRTRMWLAAAAALGLAAAPVEIEDQVRRGNRAFEEGDYAVAVKAYEAAELRTPDPGQVAYNKATALYHWARKSDGVDRIKRFAAAADHYRRCGTDDESRRRLLARFGLACSLLQTSADEAVSLREAIACLRACLADPTFDEALAADARHNLQLAKLMLAALGAEGDPPRDDERDRDQNNSKPPGGMNEDEQKGQDGDPMHGRGDPTGEKRPVQDRTGQRPIRTNERAPGQGDDMPPVRDDDKLPPLSVRDAEAHLEQAMEKILGARRAYRLRPPRPATAANKDW